MYFLIEILNITRANTGCIFPIPQVRRNVYTQKSIVLSASTFLTGIFSLIAPAVHECLETDAVAQLALAQIIEVILGGDFGFLFCRPGEVQFPQFRTFIRAPPKPMAPIAPFVFPFAGYVIASYQHLLELP